MHHILGWKCDILQRNRHYFCHQQHKTSKKQVLYLIQLIQYAAGPCDQFSVELWLWYYQKHIPEMNLPGLAELLTVAGSVQISAVTKPGLHLSVSQVALVNQAGDLTLDGFMTWAIITQWIIKALVKYNRSNYSMRDNDYHRL